jgi:uncharacterized protein (TIGR03083 family)
MRVFDMIVDERRRMAEMLANLSDHQLRQPSLCDSWTVHEVAAHLITYLRFGQAKLYSGIFATAADFDKINLRLTRQAARRPSREIVELLRRRADSRTTIPRSGYDPMLTDIVLHDLDIRLPLGISRAIPEERLWVGFHHLAAKPSLGFKVGSRLQNLRLVATDTGWIHGDGPVVRGGVESLLLAMTGRMVAFDQLGGDGVALLRQRVTSPPRIGPGRRMGSVLGVLVNPPSRERRSRLAVGDQ